MAKVSETRAETQAQTPAENAQEMMERLLAMQADMEARFKQLEEREAALKGQKAVPVAREKDIILSKAWEETREVFLPYATGGDEQWVLVSVNGRKYQVPRGQAVKVPLPLYERLMIMQEQQAKVARYRNNLPREAAPGQAVRIG